MTNNGALYERPTTKKRGTHLAVLGDGFQMVVADHWRRYHIAGFVEGLIQEPPGHYQTGAYNTTRGRRTREGKRFT